MIVRTKQGWAVKASSGRKFLSRRDLSREEALQRLQQVEHFKHVSTNAAFVSNAQPQRTDPSKTGDIRRAWVRESNARFRDLKKALIEFLVKQDELALKPPTHGLVTHARQYEFQTSAQKVEAFSSWLDDQMDSKLLSKGKGIWAGRYIDSAYKRGIVRAYIDVHSGRLGGMQKGTADATKAEFLRSAMAVPERIDSVQLLATRAFEGMKGLSSRMKTKMNFILANGLANGEGPASMAREMVDAMGIEQGRAETIARTETAHAQGEGQLSGYEELGVEEVGLQVEFLTAGDDRVCEKCQELADEGPYTIEEARGVIPVHPNCRCAWAPITAAPSKR